MTVIRLRPRGRPDPGAAFENPGARAVLVKRETAAAWIGRPVASPACSALEWPKSAWEEAKP